MMKTPIFVNGKYNKDGRRIHADFVKEVRSGDDSFKLWKTSKKKDYPRNDSDVYLLFVEIGDYIVPTGLTEWEMTKDIGWKTVREVVYGNDDAAVAKVWRETKDTDALRKQEDEMIDEYGQDVRKQADYIKGYIDKHVKKYVNARDNGGMQADYIGAAVLGEIDKCMELSKKIQQIRDEQDKRRMAEWMAVEEQKKAEREAEQKLAMENAELALKKGGVIDNGEILVKLAEKHGVTIALRTKGWIYSAFASCKVTVKEGMPEYSIRYYKKNTGTGSSKIYDVIDRIRQAVCAA